MSEHIRVLLPEEELNERIQTLGREISRDYEGRQVHMICVLKGGSFFMCDLAKRISVPVSLDFMSVSSYGSGTKSGGVVKIVKDLDEPRRVVDVNVDYTGFQIPDEFVVGFGLDYDQRYRNLPYIGVVEFDQ